MRVVFDGSVLVAAARSRRGASHALLSSGAAEKLSALTTVKHLRERALRARREDFAAFLDASPDVPPLPGDEP